MIDHVTISVSNLKRSKKFYQKAFVPLGYKISFGEEGIFWAFDIGSEITQFKIAQFEIAQYKGDSPITSCHIAFRVENKEKVQEFYKAAISAGAKDNGAPGPRPQYSENYYACFIFDPDGHNIEAMCETAK